MSLKVDTVQLKIIIEMDKTRQEMKSLDDNFRSIKKGIKEVERSHKNGKISQDEYKRSIASLNAELEKNRNAHAQLRESIPLTSMSISELQQRQRDLNVALRNLNPKSEDFQRYARSAQDVARRLREVQSQATVTQSRLASMADGFNRYWQMTAGVIATVIASLIALKKVAMDYAAMDDVYAKVSKTTDLTHEGVIELNESFKKLDTRTAREKLNGLAEDAGRLGIKGVNDVLQFTKAGDKINMALGDILGDGAVKEIGKLVEIFKASTTELNGRSIEDRLLMMGSALNELGKTSSADEKQMLNFTSRLGGVASMAGLSAQNVMGFASALDQMKMPVEMSATAFQKLINLMMKNTKFFAQQAGIPFKDFDKMVKDDINSAIMAVLSAWNRMPNYKKMAEMLDEGSMAGERVTAVMASLAGNIDKVTEAQIISNKAFNEGTSIVNEANIINNNKQAELEKRQKTFKDLTEELGKKLYPVIMHSYSGFSYLVKALNWTIDNFSTLATVIGSITVAWVSYNVTTRITLITSKAMAVGHALETAALWLKETAIQATAIATALFSGNIKKAATETKKFFAILNLNPIGALVGAITAVVAAILIYNSTSSKQTEAMKAMDDIQKKVNESTSEQISKVQALKNIVHDANQTDAVRLNAIAQLKKIVPEYTAELSKEGEVIRENTTAVDQYIESLKRKALAEAVQSKIKDLYGEILDNNDSIDKGGKLEYWEGVWSLVGSSGTQGMKDANARKIVTLRNENKKIQATIDKLTADNADVLTGTDPIKVPVVLDLQYKNDKKYKKEVDKIKNELQSSINTITEEYKKGVITSGQGLDKLNDAQDKYNKSLETLNAKSKKKNNNNETKDTTGKAGTSDPYANELKEIDKSEEQKKLILQKNYQEGTLAEQAYNERRIQNEIDANNRRMNLANTFIDRKNAKMQEYQIAYLKAEVAANAGYEKLDEEHYKKLLKNKKDRLSTLDKQDAGSKNSLATKVESGDITQADYNSTIIAIDLATASTRKEIQRDFINELQQMEWESAIAKESILGKEGNNLATLETAQLKAREKANNDFFKKVQSNERAAKDFMKKYSGKGNDTELKIEQLDSSYNLIDKTKLTQEQLLLLEKTYQDAKNEIISDGENEASRIRQQLGYNKIEEQYKTQLKDLKKSLNKGLITQKEHESAVFDAKVEKAKAYYDVVASGMSNLVSSLKDAAISQVEAEYDAKINAAEDGSEEQQRLEEEKQQKIKEVHKKYADIEFAMRVSEIIANTAVAIMAAWKLGPIMGGIMTPIIAATGVMQVVSANAEREKVKGYKKGGYTNAGANDNEVAGEVHANEFVGTANAVRNPAINRIFSIINTAQLAGRVSMINTTDLFRQEQAKLFQVLPIQTVTEVISQRSEDSKTLRELQSTIKLLNYEISNGIYAETRISIAGENGIARNTERYNAMRKHIRRPYK